jgi:hypothetical protein
MERRLDDQLDALRDTAARVLFIPGNHDWDKGSANGRETLRRQQMYVEARAWLGALFLPKDGCPGPSVLDTGRSLRLVALDTQWWLQARGKPLHPTSTCDVDSEEEVIAALREALATPREVVVLAHHPLVSGGPHGGSFGWRKHLFPLVDVASWAWVPLPVIGSLYPEARKAGISPQDQSSTEYRRMRDAFASAIARRPPLAWASGHEHVLQVIESARFGRVLVSGAGIFGHVTRVRPVEGCRYRASRAGYMRIDLLEDGQRRLTVIEVDENGASHDAYAQWLE